MPENSWLVIGAIVAILLLIGVGWLIQFLVKSTPEADRKAIPIPTLLGVSALGAVALVCSAGITYGLSVGQTGSIETRQQELTSQTSTQANSDSQKSTQTNSEQTPVGDSVGTQGVVSSSQGLGILGTIGSAAVGGIAGVLVQRSTS